MDKPREFWIAPKLYSPADPVEAEYFVAYDQPGDHTRLEIHVIEYSAYEQIQRELEQVHFVHQNDLNDLNRAHQEEIEDLKKIISRQARELLTLEGQTLNLGYETRSLPIQVLEGIEDSYMVSADGKQVVEFKRTKE